MRPCLWGALALGLGLGLAAVAGSGLPGSVSRTLAMRLGVPTGDPSPWRSSAPLPRVVPVEVEGTWTAFSLEAGACPGAISPEPEFVFYNRLPKCGSTTFGYVLKDDATARFFGPTHEKISAVVMHKFMEVAVHEGKGYKRANIADADNRWREMYPEDVAAYGQMIEKRIKALDKEGGWERSGEGGHTLVYFHRHMFLHPELRVFGKVPTYIQLMRHPVSRAVSRWYYSRAKVDRGRPTSLRATLWATAGFKGGDLQVQFKTMDDCLAASGAQDSPRCSLLDPVPDVGVSTTEYAKLCWSFMKPEPENKMWPDERLPPCWEYIVREELDEYFVRWMCGGGAECEDPHTEAAYARALSNMHSYYAFVGVLEELPATMRLFQRILPGLFATEGAAANWEKLLAENVRRNPSEYDDPSPAVHEMLEARNVWSTKLWEYARQKVLELDAACSGGSLTTG